MVPTGSAVVVAVVDGDTIDVSFEQAGAERVRLIGIDAPESVSPSTPEQCFGAEASEALTDLLPPGTRVRLERDLETRDRYGRLLAYVHHDDVLINARLIEHGYANAVFYAPNTAYEVEFTRREAKAREAGVGLWSACDGPDQPLEQFPDTDTVGS